MGIYDREYYRREGPSFLGAFAGRGQVCKWLILVNVAVFILQLVVHPQEYPRVLDGEVVSIKQTALDHYLQLDTEAVLHGQVWRLLTYAFLHGGFFHILFNMLFLWWFGSDVEDLYGPREFLAFYLVSAVLGGLAFEAAWLLGWQIGIFCVGASGAVLAVMVLCALHFPSRVIYIWFFLPVPIWLFVVFEVAQDAFGFLSGGPGTAFSVHLGGAAFAFVYYKLHWRLLNILPGLRNWQQQRTRPRLRVYHGEETPPQVAVPVPPVSPEVDEHLEAQLDAVLEKVARFGQQSLTDSERQVLLHASEVYKKRRT